MSATSRSLPRSAARAGFALLALPALATACTGAIGGSDSPGAGPPKNGDTTTVSGPGGAATPTGNGAAVVPMSSTPGPTAGVAACAQRLVGPSPLRRLTNAEYDNTVRDLLSDTTGPAKAFPEQNKTSAGSFSNDAASLTVAPLVIESFMTAAEQLAAGAVKNLNALLGCSPAGAGEEACVRQFLERFGKRAYRRPLASTETGELLALYKTIRTKRDVARSVEVTLRAMLQSPHFLYRLELGASGAAGAAVALTAHEIASRLSYGLWGSMPDDALFAAADGGQLKTPEQVAGQARRLLASPRSRAVQDQFYVEWLDLDSLPGVEKNTKVYPEFATVKEVMGRETAAFLNHVLRERDARFETLLTAPVTFVNAALAKLYGLTGIAGTELKRVDLDPKQRAGILTQPSILAVHGRPDQSDPILRGKMVREQFLCQELPSPPGDVDTNVKPPDPRSTTRERFAQHRADPKCSACHNLIDPIGFGFESYDGIGKFRTMDGTFPIDNEGALTGTRDMDGPFRGVPELARKLAASTDARECVTKLSFRYMFGRAATPEDACSLAVANKVFAASSHDLRELLIGLTETDSFMYRIPNAGGTR